MSKVDYKKGKIYKIMSDLGYDFYIGSTAQLYLSNRMSQHCYDYKNRSCYSYKVFDLYGIDNCYIKLIELYPCNSKQELEIKEKYYIRTTICVNHKINIIKPISKDEEFYKFLENNINNIKKELDIITKNSFAYYYFKQK